MMGQFPDLGKASDLDCEQSLVFLKFSEGSARARERWAAKPREAIYVSRALFAQRTKKKEKLLVVRSP